MSCIVELGKPMERCEVSKRWTRTTSALALTLIAIRIADVEGVFERSVQGQTVTATWQDNANGQMFDSNGAAPGGGYTWPDNRLWTQEEEFGEVAGVLVMTEPSNWSTPFYPDNGRGGVNYHVIIPATNDPAVAGPPPQWVRLQGTEVTINSMVVQQFGRVELRALGSVTDQASITIVDGDLLNDGVIDLADNPGGAELIFAHDSEITGSGEITLLDTSGNNITPVRVNPGFTVTMADGHIIRGNGDVIAGDPTLGGGFVNNGDILSEQRSAGNTGGMRIAGSGFVNNKRIAAIQNAFGDSLLSLHDLQMSQGVGGAITAESANVHFERATISGGTITGSGGGMIEIRSGRTTFSNGATILHTAQMGATQMFAGEGLALASGGVYNFTGDNSVAQNSGGGGERSFDVLTGGLLRKSGGAGQSLVDTPVNLLGGTIDATSGTLVLADGGTSTGGHFSAGAGATIDLTGGSTHTYSGTYTNSGAGKVSLASGTIVTTAGGSVTLNFTGDGFQWSGGRLNTGGGDTNVTNTGVINIVDGPNDDATVRVTLINRGTVRHARDDFGLNVVSAGVIDNFGLWDFTSDGSLDFISGGSGARDFDNAAGGVLRKSGGVGTSTVDLPFNNAGTVEVQTGAMAFTSSVVQTTGTTLTGGTWKVGAGASLVLDGGNLITNGGNVVLSGAGSTFAQINTLANNQGTFEINAGRNFTTAGNLANSGTVRIAKNSTLTVNGVYTQAAGGRLRGKGKLVTTTFNNSGSVSPGDSPGILEVEGNYGQAATGELEIEIGGLVAGDQRDLLAIIGSATLGGAVNASFIDAGGGLFQPNEGQLFTILTATGGVTESFAELRIVNPGDKYIRGQLKYNANDVALEILSTDFLAADFNEDTQVNSADLGLWKAGLGTTSGAAHLNGDADGDRDVDGQDFLVWQRQLGRSTPVPTSAEHRVPEPSGSALLAIGVAAAIGCRRMQR